MPNRGAHGARQTKEWRSLPGGGPINMTATGTFGLSALPFTSPSTILRMIGEYVLSATPGGTFAASDAVGIMMAIGIISSDAFAVGTTAFPDPGGEPQYPWLFWKDHAFLMEDATPSPSAPPVVVRHSFDIGSMRRIKPRESLIWAIEYGDIAGAPPMTAILGSTRVLIGLH